MKKRKRGVIIVLVGAGIFLLTFILASESYMTGRGGQPYLSGGGINFFGFQVELKYPIAVATVIALVGIGMIILSFFPEEKKTIEKGDE